MDRFYLRKGLLIALVLASLNATARPSVNVISWWGYLSDPALLAPIEESCGARISLDEYTTNPEFLRRITKMPYNIAIYSDAISSSLTNLIPPNSTGSLANLSDSYIPAISSAFTNENHLKNTVYFQLSLTGFLWNRKNITLDKNDTIEEIFAKAKGKTVVLVDDHVEILSLVSEIMDKHREPLKSNVFSFDRLKELVEKTKIISTTDIARLYEMPDFAFAYLWSGEAIAKVKESKSNDLQFMLHPDVSHWSKDLLTMITDDAATRCVAEALGGNKFISKLSSNTFYFSPFGDIEYPVENLVYKELSTSFFDTFPNLRSALRLTAKEYSQADVNWQHFKMSLLQPQ
jgi:spermidine/putrescine-binding protein